MSVQLDPPHTLGFRRPLTQLVKKSLQVRNPNQQPVAFKVKTTAPKLYCVRPNSGRIEPGETVEVQVMLQAMKEEPPLAAKCKDKFLVQSTFITAAKETLPLQEIWNGTDDSNEETKVHQQKIKVAYLAAEGTIDEEDELAAANQSSMLAPSDSKYDTVKPFSSTDTNGHAPIPQFERSFDNTTTPPEEHHDAPEPAEPAHAPAPAPAAPEPQPAIPTIPVPPVTVNVHSPAPIMPVPAPFPAPGPVAGTVSADEHDELRARFEEAQAELTRMRALLQAMPDPSLARAADERSEADTATVADERTVGPSELRRRTRMLSDARSDVSSTVGGSTYGGAATTAGGSSVYGDDFKVEVPEGVPLQVVIMIALGVFVSTYLFF